MLEDSIPGILAYLGLSYLFIVMLGYFQTPATLPCNQQESRHSGLYAALALAAVCVQAFVTILLFRGTHWFPGAAVFLAATILSHHAMIHRNSRFEGETCSCAPFQCKDVGNHETWVVASLVAGAVSLLRL
jgi:hypothetical protein